MTGPSRPRHRICGALLNLHRRNAAMEVIRGGERDRGQEVRCEFEHRGGRTAARLRRQRSALPRLPNFGEPCSRHSVRAPRERGNRPRTGPQRSAQMLHRGVSGQEPIALLLACDPVAGDQHHAEVAAGDLLLQPFQRLDDGAAVARPRRRSLRTNIAPSRALSLSGRLSLTSATPPEISIRTRSPRRRAPAIHAPLPVFPTRKGRGFGVRSQSRGPKSSA